MKKTFKMTVSLLSDFNGPELLEIIEAVDMGVNRSEFTLAIHEFVQKRLDHIYREEAAEPEWLIDNPDEVWTW